MWNKIMDVLRAAQNHVRVYENRNDIGERLCAWNINEASVLGNILMNTNGINVEGYIRIYGGGGEKKFDKYNDKLKSLESGRKLYVADDIFGGLFAIGNGDFDGNAEQMWYFAPDTMEWEQMEFTYAGFINWCANADVLGYYKSWDCLETREIRNTIEENQGVSIYPFLWTAECDINSASKKVVPFFELIEMTLSEENNEQKRLQPSVD